MWRFSAGYPFHCLPFPFISPCSVLSSTIHTHKAICLSSCSIFFPSLLQLWPLTLGFVCSKLCVEGLILGMRLYYILINGSLSSLTGGVRHTEWWSWISSQNLSPLLCRVSPSTSVPDLACQAPPLLVMYIEIQWENHPPDRGHLSIRATLCSASYILIMSEHYQKRSLDILLLLSFLLAGGAYQPVGEHAGN